MGSKTRGPTAADYAPDELENTATRIAIADKGEFNRLYNPLLKEMRDKAATEDVESTFVGRANADMQQQMGAGLDISMAKAIGQSAEKATAAVSNILGARTQALTAKRGEQTGVLAAARGQEGNTSTALGQAARVQLAENVNKATNQNKIRMARRQAAFNIALAGGSALAGKFSPTQQMASTDLSAPGSVGGGQSVNLNKSQFDLASINNNQNYFA